MTLKTNDSNVQMGISAFESELALLKSKAKTEQNDPALINLIQTITTLLEDVNGKATSKTASHTPSNADVGQSLVMVAEALGQLQVLIGKYGAEKAKMNTDVQQAMIQEAQSNVANAQKDLDKIIQQTEHQSFWQKLLHWIEGILGALLALVAGISGQPQLAVMMILLTVTSETGGFDKLSKAISSLLQDMGVPKKEADLVGSIVVVVATIVAAAMTCGAAAPAAVTETGTGAAINTAGSAATEIATVAEEAVATTETAATETQSVSRQIMEKIVEALKKVMSTAAKYNPFSKLSTAANMGILAGSQALMGSSLVPNIMPLLSKLSEKDKEKLQEALSILMELLSVTVSLGSGAALGTSAVVQNGLKVPASLFTTVSYLTLGGQLAETGAQAELAAINISMADSQAQLAVNNGLMEFFQEMTKQVSSIAANDQKTLGEVEGTLAKEVLQFSMDANKASRELAQILCEKAV